MQTKSTNKFILLWLFVILPITGALIFRNSFNLGLYGDDWQHLYILWKDFFVYHTKSFFDIKSYLNPYFPESLYLGIIEHFWGYYPPAYFITSFVCRIFANIALFFLAYELTKDKLAAFLTTLIFLVSAAGLQTTDWVFNMNTYIGLGFLLMATTFYLKIRQIRTLKSWYYIFFIISFTFALAVVPTRMHGAVPFIILTEAFLTYIVERQKIKFDKYLIIRLTMAIAIFALLIHFNSFGSGAFTSSRFNDGYNSVQILIRNGYRSWWLYFIAIIGHLILPNNDNPVKNTFTIVLIIETVISMLFCYISSHSILRSKKVISYLPILVINLVWTIFLIIMNKQDFHTPDEVYFSIYLGGQFLFWAFWFYIIGKNKHPNIASTFIISVFWIISLTLLYWLFTPNYIIETTGRYMTMGAAGVAIFLGALCTLLFRNSISSAKSNKLGSRFLASFYIEVPALILMVFLLNNFQAGQNYFNILTQTRNKDLTERTWKTLLKEVPELDPTAPSLFYFTTDNPLSLEGVLVFGFFMRAGIEWRNPVDALTPLPVTDYQQLLDMVKTGEPLQKVHGRKKEPVSLSRVYAFDFREGELINITEEVRKKVIEDLQLKNSSVH